LNAVSDPVRTPEQFIERITPERGPDGVAGGGFEKIGAESSWQ
jgi:hypothetical protein